MADVDEQATSPQVDPDEVPTGCDDARRWVMGRIGHRLRTPLSLVTATTDLLRSSGPVRSGPRARHDTARRRDRAGATRRVAGQVAA